MFRETLDVTKAYLAVAADDVRALYLGAQIFVRLGERTTAVEWTERALDLQPDQPGVLYNAACVHAMLDETDRALDLLEESLKAGFAHTSWIPRDPDLANLRGNPRFRKLVASS
jgi:tetratricopeptide (TPR) repeat protein